MDVNVFKKLIILAACAVTALGSFACSGTKTKDSPAQSSKVSSASSQKSQKKSELKPSLGKILFSQAPKLVLKTNAASALLSPQAKAARRTAASQDQVVFRVSMDSPTRSAFEPKTSGLSTAMERLESGIRVNSAKDDAGGLDLPNTVDSRENETLRRRGAVKSALDSQANILMSAEQRQVALAAPASPSGSNSVRITPGQSQQLTTRKVPQFSPGTGLSTSLGAGRPSGQANTVGTIGTVANRSPSSGGGSLATATAPSGESKFPFRKPEPRSPEVSGIRAPNPLDPLGKKDPLVELPSGLRGQSGDRSLGDKDQAKKLPGVSGNSQKSGAPAGPGEKLLPRGIAPENARVALNLGIETMGSQPENVSLKIISMFEVAFEEGVWWQSNLYGHLYAAIDNDWMPEKWRIQAIAPEIQNDFAKDCHLRRLQVFDFGEVSEDDYEKGRWLHKLFFPGMTGRISGDRAEKIKVQDYPIAPGCVATLPEVPYRYNHAYVIMLSPVLMEKQAGVVEMTIDDFYTMLEKAGEINDEPKPLYIMSYKVMSPLGIFLPITVEPQD